MNRRLHDLEAKYELELQDRVEGIDMPQFMRFLLSHIMTSRPTDDGPVDVFELQSTFDRMQAAAIELCNTNPETFETSKTSMKGPSKSKPGTTAKNGIRNLLNE